MPLMCLGLAAIAVDSFLVDLPRWPLARRPGDFPGFGQPVLAPAAATVVRAHDAERDHWSRNSVPGLLYLVAEGMVRELLRPGRSRWPAPAVRALPGGRRRPGRRARQPPAVHRRLGGVVAQVRSPQP
jgi:hypothetical protein